MCSNPAKVKKCKQLYVYSITSSCQNIVENLNLFRGMCAVRKKKLVTRKIVLLQGQASQDPDDFLHDEAWIRQRKHFQDNPAGQAARTGEPRAREGNQCCGAGYPFRAQTILRIRWQRRRLQFLAIVNISK
jgi:hypothetical protein